MRDQVQDEHGQTQVEDVLDCLNKQQEVPLKPHADLSGLIES